MFALCEARLRSFTICKQACIVLAGTSFATTETLVSQRSAESKARLSKRGGEYEFYNNRTPPAEGHPLLAKRGSFIVAKVTEKLSL